VVPRALGSGDGRELAGLSAGHAARRETDIHSGAKSNEAQLQAAHHLQLSAAGPLPLLYCLARDGGKKNFFFPLFWPPPPAHGGMAWGWPPCLSDGAVDSPLMETFEFLQNSPAGADRGGGHPVDTGGAQQSWKPQDPALFAGRSRHRKPREGCEGWTSSLASLQTRPRHGCETSWGLVLAIAIAAIQCKGGNNVRLSRGGQGGAAHLSQKSKKGVSRWHLALKGGLSA